MFDAADRQAMLEAVGVLAELTVGGDTFYVKPPRYADPQMAFTGTDVESVNPFCTAAKEDVARLNIVAGESGTVITLLGRDYRVLSIEPANNGFYAIELGAI